MFFHKKRRLLLWQCVSRFQHRRVCSITVTNIVLYITTGGLSASAGPVLGPLIGGYASSGFPGPNGDGDWRWTIWPLLILSGFTLIVLTFTMPETSATNILHRRAERLRQVTGNPHLRSKGEIFASNLTGNEIAMMTFVRPFRLGIFEPIALSINLHIGMVYGVLYVVSSHNFFDIPCRKNKC